MKIFTILFLITLFSCDSIIESRNSDTQNEDKQKLIDNLTFDFPERADTTFFNSEFHKGNHIKLENIELIKITDFLNEINLDYYDDDPNLLPQIFDYTIGHGIYIEKVIKSLDTLLDKQNIEFMLSQLDSNSYQLDDSQLKNVDCFNDFLIDSLFSSNRFENEESITIVNPWQNVGDIYGHVSLSAFSKPIFSINDRYCIIAMEWIADWEEHGKVIHIWEFNDFKWSLIRFIPTEEITITNNELSL